MSQKFNPSSYAVKNGNFIGLPYNEENARIVLLPVPWEATVSYSAGTARGPENILEASYQLDLYDLDVKDAYKIGIFMRPVDQHILELSDETRELASLHIDNLENGHKSDPSIVSRVNEGSKKLNDWVHQHCSELLDNGKIVGLIGGDHSTPFGYLKALSERHESFGILHIDAHCDLRKAYEGFTYSHASIFYNALESFSNIEKLVQVGIRDYCEEEMDYIFNSNGRVEAFFDQAMNEAIYTGNTYYNVCKAIIDKLPEKVYISFDIDGLLPNLCPNTGTPVPGGLTLQQAFYLIKMLSQSGKKIIGVDVCEVGSASEWDGNVGARVVYKLSNLSCKNNHPTK
jgi:agmatinase